MTKIKRRLLLTQSDERLACLVQAGHEPAFEALVHRYRRPLLRYCQRLCDCDARAEEALQQALMNAWMALRSETEVRDPRAWLYRIARNAAINSMRGEADQTDAHIDLFENALSPVASTARIDQAIELREVLADVAALPQMQREVMVRTALAGHSHEEVASELGISDGAVRGLLYRARATLRTGFTAITPTPLLAWASSGVEQGVGAGGARIAEIAAGGGTAGLAMKVGAAALTAGVMVSGVVASHGRHPSPSDHAGRRRVASRDPGLVAPRAHTGVRAQATRVSLTHGTLVRETSLASPWRRKLEQEAPLPTGIAHRGNGRFWHRSNPWPVRASGRMWHPGDAMAHRHGAVSHAVWRPGGVHGSAPDSPPPVADRSQGGPRNARYGSGGRWGTSRAAEPSRSNWSAGG